MSWGNSKVRNGGDAMSEPMSDSYVDIVFDGPPSHEAGRFVETEDAKGSSIKFGEWVHRDDGYWVLRISQATEIDRLRAELAAAKEDNVLWQQAHKAEIERLRVSMHKARIALGLEVERVNLIEAKLAAAKDALQPFAHIATTLHFDAALDCRLDQTKGGGRLSWGIHGECFKRAREVLIGKARKEPKS